MLKGIFEIRFTDMCFTESVYDSLSMDISSLLPSLIDVCLSICRS